MPRLLLVVAALAAACFTSPAPTSSSPSTSSAAAKPLATPVLCEHAVPAAECVRCHPGLVPAFKARNDWCPEHERPETQCLECHPGTIFVELPPIAKEADFQHLSTMGEDVASLEAHLAPGKVTVFDFFALWCGPCRNVDAYLFTVVNERRDVALRKLNVMSWDTPVAKHYLAKVPSLPYVVVYGRDGRLVRAVSGLDVPAIEAAIAEGAAR